ncbi:MAG: hypothetical protein RLZZ104_63, partial [Pseudomonadota bacterium]
SNWFPIHLLQAMGMSMSNPKASACPLCGHPEDAQHKPFCSKGCKDRDLLNWLGEGYRMKGPPADPDLPEDWPENWDGDR